jgi:hypothetical protein
MTAIMNHHPYAFARKSLHFLLLVPVFVIATSCSQGRQQNVDLEPRYEAASWLESNPNPHALAGNRFTSTEEALTFVEALYEHGAPEVLVTGIYDEDWRIEAEGGPYADTLIIRLPPEVENRRMLFEIANEEATREGFSPVRDIGQDELLLWWD